MTPAQKRKYTMADEAGKKALLAAQRKQIRAAEEEATIAQRQAAAAKRSEAARKGVETRRLNAERKAAEAAEAEARGRQKPSFGSRIRGMGQRGGGMAGMALSGAMMMGSMAGGPAGDAMGAIAGPLMGVASMMSMIPGPAGLVVGALAGVGMAALAVNQAMNDARDKALAFGNAMGAGTANMEKLASFTGQVTDSQVKAKERLDIMTQGKAANGAADSVGGQFLASDTGKALTDSIAASIKNVDMATIKEQIYQQMATAVTTGAMDTATAKSIVDALGQKLKDPAFAVTINAKLSDLLGPNGEKLEGDKLNVVAELSKQSVTSVQGQISQLTSTLPDAGLNWARISEVAGLTVSTGVQAIEQQKQLLDSLDVEYEKRMANAKATGASASEQQKITDEYKKSRDENIKAQNETLNPVADPYAAAVGINLKTGNLLRTSNSIAAGEMGKAMDTQIENKYKDDAIQLELAKQARDKIVGSEGNNPGAMTKQEQAQAQVREYKLKAVLAEGDIPPQAFLDLLKGTEGNEAAASKQNQFVVDIIGKVGNADGAMMVQMASAMNEPQKLAFEATLTGDPEKVKQMTDMYQEIYKSGGQEAVNLVANLEVKSQGQGADAQQATTRLAKLKQGFKDIAELTANGPITMETLIKTNGDFEGLKDQAEYFNSLPAAQQKVFVERYLTVYDTVSPAEATAWMRDQTGQTTGTMLARDNAGRGQTFTQEEAMQAYAANSAREFTNAIGGASGLNEDNNNSDGGGGGGGGTPAKTIEDVISAQQKLITQTNDQKQAIQSLVSSGLSLADAYKVASNAEDAALIAHGANTEQIQRLTEATKEAEKATKSFAAAQNLAQSVQENIDKKALALKLAADSTLTNTQKQAIVDNKDLANLYMNPTFDPTTLQKALDDAANARSYELQIKKLTISGMQDIWKQGFDKASQAFSAQQNVIEIKFKAAKSPFENIVKAGQRAIEDIQNRPGGLDDLDADLQRISDKEQDINKAYDDKVKALEQVSKVNDKIIAQQKSQLTLADALTQGDIAAAAKAAQDMRAQDVSSGMQSQREMLDQSRKNEIDSLTGNSGMTRDQIEEKVRDLKAEVLAIEENSIEPAQRRIALLDRQMQDQIDTLTVLGKTKEKWDAINASLELANTKTKEFQDAMREALNIASTLGTALTTGVVPTVGGLTTPTTPTAPTAPARAEYVYPGEATWGSGSDVVKKLQTALNKGGAGLTVDGVFGPLTAAALKNFQSSNGLVADADAGPLTWRKLYDVGYYAKGGMVPYMASGGMAKMLAKGTDTIPAMLSAGEFVMKKSAVDQIGASKLAQMNDGKYQHQEASNSVYNINVQAQTDASPEDIARVVMQKMASVDRYRTTGNRF
jgi:peptidoglycan hydrolase-like protein with peptidoglycan-binding domain